MTRNGLHPTRRNAHSDVGPERVAETMIVRFGRNHLLFARFVAATAEFMLDAVGSLFHHEAQTPVNSVSKTPLTR